MQRLITGNFAYLAFDSLSEASQSLGCLSPPSQNMSNEEFSINQAFSYINVWPYHITQVQSVSFAPYHDLRRVNLIFFYQIISGTKTTIMSNRI